MSFCAARKPGLYRRVGIAGGLKVMDCADNEADEQTIRFISGLLADLGLKGPLRDYGVKRENLEALVTQAFEDPCHKTNAVPVSREDLRRLYEEVL
jgi:alcohol dehydrogenase class IV